MSHAGSRNAMLLRHIKPVASALRVAISSSTAAIGAIKAFPTASPAASNLASASHVPEVALGSARRHTYSQPVSLRGWRSQSAVSQPACRNIGGMPPLGLLSVPAAQPALGRAQGLPATAAAPTSPQPSAGSLPARLHVTSRRGAAAHAAAASATCSVPATTARQAALQRRCFGSGADQGAGGNHNGSGDSGSAARLASANLFAHPTLRKNVKICGTCSASASHSDSHPHNSPGARPQNPTKPALVLEL